MSYPPGSYPPGFPNNNTPFQGYQGMPAYPNKNKAKRKTTIIVILLVFILAGTGIGLFFWKNKTMFRVQPNQETNFSIPHTYPILSYASQYPRISSPYQEPSYQYQEPSYPAQEDTDFNPCAITNDQLVDAGLPMELGTKEDQTGHDSWAFQTVKVTRSCLYTRHEGATVYTVRAISFEGEPQQLQYDGTSVPTGDINDKPVRVLSQDFATPSACVLISPGAFLQVSPDDSSCTATVKLANEIL